MCKCVKCGWEWLQRHPDKVPQMCPACKRRDWDGVHNSLGGVLVPPVLRKCCKCGYDWKQRQSSKIPQACPACKSYKWDISTPQAECFMCNGAGCPVCKPVAVSVAVSDYPIECFACGGVGRADGLKCPICGVVRGAI